MEAAVKNLIYELVMAKYLLFIIVLLPFKSLAIDSIEMRKSRFVAEIMLSAEAVDTIEVTFFINNIDESGYYDDIDYSY
ncbi:MAG: hypothetical protein PF487_12590 [Bacteroidales bacterium]|jgi:ABC-type sulfate transport system permease component|nr:hypothetical protein [Bacteroidales bacterium]